MLPSDGLFISGVELAMDREYTIQVADVVDVIVLCELQQPFVEPLISVLCWHVLCERCWLQVLQVNRLCIMYSVLQKNVGLSLLFNLFSITPFIIDRF